MEIGWRQRVLTASALLAGAWLLAGCMNPSENGGYGMQQGPPPAYSRPAPPEQRTVADTSHPAADTGADVDSIADFHEELAKVPESEGRVMVAPKYLDAGYFDPAQEEKDRYVFVPATAKDPNWQPYQNGQWVQTDAGLAWDSQEPGGDITYHYGRWAYTREAGWVWVPGRTYAPAWVAWRGGDQYSGWAPLPPAVYTSAGVEAVYDADAVPPVNYVFVENRYVTERVTRDRVISRARNVEIVKNTTNITNITVNNGQATSSGSMTAIQKKVDAGHVAPFKVAKPEVVHSEAEAAAVRAKGGGALPVVQAPKKNVTVATSKLPPPAAPPVSPARTPPQPAATGNSNGGSKPPAETTKRPPTVVPPASPPGGGGRPKNSPPNIPGMSAAALGNSKPKADNKDQPVKADPNVKPTPKKKPPKPDNN